MVEIQRDSHYFEHFDIFVGTYEDWYSDLSGGGVFEDWKCFGFDFGFDFVVVEQFDSGYFKDGVAFGGGCFEDEVKFGRMQKHIGDFG